MPTREGNRSVRFKLRRRTRGRWRVPPAAPVACCILALAARLPAQVPEDFVLEMPLLPADASALNYGLQPWGPHGGGHALDGHPGWDIEFRRGGMVRAAADGVVQRVFPDADVRERWTIQVEHRRGSRVFRTVYTNIEQVAPEIVDGAPVAAGQPLGVPGVFSSQRGGVTIFYAVTHFQLDDFSFAGTVGCLSNCNSVPIEPYLSPSGRAVFEAIWRTAAYFSELVEPFPANPRDVAFPLTRTWTLRGGTLPPRIDFRRLDPRNWNYEYTLYSAGGSPLERGTLLFDANPLLSTVDLQPSGGGPARLGIWDIVGGTMRIAWNGPGGPRPSSLAGASIYETADPALDVPTYGMGAGGIRLQVAPLPAAVTGYGRIRPSLGSALPAGVALFGCRSRGVLTSETAVPALPPLRQGRIFVETGGGVDTGVAIANMNAQPVDISYYFTDPEGRSFGAGSTTVEAHGQRAAFLSGPPFFSGVPASATFTFSATGPVGVIALRGRTNARGDFLLSSLPVVTPGPGPGGNLFPYFADGGGWSTELVLINPGEETLSGTLQFFGPAGPSGAGEPLLLNVNGQTARSFAYLLPPRSAGRFRTAGLETDPAMAGSCRITPLGAGSPPAGVAFFSLVRGGATVAEAGVPLLPPAATWRIPVEVPGQALTGVAVANTSPDPAPVLLELTTLAGQRVEGASGLTIPGRGHVAAYINQIPGFERLRAGFQGILRISSTSGVPLSVIGLRSRANEAGDLLITTMPATSGEPDSTAAELLFPHFAAGGDCSTEFILFSGTGSRVSGALRFFSTGGEPVLLKVR